ncbi:MAG: hypothetical protein ACRC6I_16955 [Paracoccaceae bacterium]
MTLLIHSRASATEIEEGQLLAQHFPIDGLAPDVTTKAERRFDPAAVYGDAVDPTIL